MLGPMNARLASAALVCACWLAAPCAQAQTAPDHESPDPAPGAEAAPPPAEDEVSEVRRLEAARRAFDRGTAYALSEDYGRAAAQFETAYRLVPSPRALERAMQAHLRSGHALRATTLALRLVGAHPDDEATRRAAEEVIATHGAEYVRLELDCDECILAVEGRVRSFHQVMLEPNTDHRVVVERGEASRTHIVRGEPGERLRLGAPSPAATVVRVEERPPALSSGEPPGRAPAPAGDGVPLEPWVFGLGAGLTAVAGALLIWSGVDTLAGVDEFNDMPTRPAFEEGEAKELRTNVLIAVTAGLAALSLLAAIFTDWDGDGDAGADAGLFFDEHRLGAWARLRL